MTTTITILVTAGMVVLSVLGLLATRRRVQLEELRTHHEVGGFVFGALHLIYGVMLAFVMFVAWTNYEAAKDNVAIEADQIVDLLRLSQGLPEEDRVAIRHALRSYTFLVIDEEWDTMRSGHEGPRVEQAIDHLWRLYIGASTNLTHPLYQESLDRMVRLGDARRGRLRDCAGGMPSLLWALLVIVGIVVIVFTYFFGTQNVGAQILMTVALAGEIAFILFLIQAIDQPFDGAMRLGNAPLRRALERIDSSPQ